MGDRMGDITDDIPKALVRVAEKELILHVMDFLDHPAISERIVVTGFGAEKLVDFLGNNRRKAKFVHNPDFSEGNILTMKSSLPAIAGEFLIMNADHIYPKRMLGHILEARKGISAICDFDRRLGPDDMKVKLNCDRKLSQIKKTLVDYDGGYIGMTFCNEDCIDTYAGSLNAVIEERGGRACVEDVLGLMAKEHNNINICDTSGISWLEVDDPKDLEHAESVLRNNTGFLS